MRERRTRPTPRAWLRAHPLAADTLGATLAVLVNLWATTERAWGGYEFRGPDVWALLLAVLGGAPLALRRRYPTTVATLCGAAYYVQGFAEYNSGAGGFVVLFTLYNVGAYGGRWRGLCVTLAEAAASMIYMYVNPELLAEVQVELGFLLLAMTFIQFPGVWLIGRAVGARRMYLKELEDRADRLERTAQAEIRAALAEERTRVARELHDVVAHHVSVMTVQAAAARRTLARDPERAGEAMQAVENTGRAALDEMRRIVGALRNVDPETAADGARPSSAELLPQPGTAELGALVDRARKAGLRVELSVIGRPRDLPPSVDLAIYRIVQEALTNTLKHAGPTEARVTIRYEPDRVDVAVIDDGPDRRRRPDAGSGMPVLGASHASASAGEKRRGHGLIGMGERVHLNGGTLRTGPRATGGFEVWARLPLENDGAAQAAAARTDAPADRPGSEDQGSSEGRKSSENRSPANHENSENHETAADETREDPDDDRSERTATNTPDAAASSPPHDDARGAYDAVRP